MSNRAYEIAFELGAKIQSSFNSAFTNANKQIGNLGGGLADAIGTAAKFGAGISLAAEGAALAVKGLAVNVSEDLQRSLNGLQSQTGMTDEVMANMRENMLDIYNNNFGDSFEDIGSSMAIVAKQTGLTSEALESATTNALMMRDTFGMDVNESINAVNQLMKQFGLSSEDAYNLMAQGAQNGMNSQEDLTDIIKEYSVQFKNMGFSGEEMFNMLSNGAKAGGFSIDVMGDAMKEFNIRSKDGSKSTEGAFKSLGLNADDLTKAFGKGGVQGKKAFGDVISKLKGIKDPIEQNATGVALFGTMWEDLGAKSILALGDTKGKIDETKDALKGINDVKYNTFGEAMQGIWRNIETGVLIPIGDALLPALKNFSTWITTDMPQIKTEIVDAMLVAQTAFDNVSDGVSAGIDWFKKYQEILIPLAAGIAASAIAFGIYTLAVEAHTLATKISTAATKAFGIASKFATSSLGIAVIAIGAVVAAGVLLYRNWDTIKVVATNVFGAIGSFIGGVAEGISSTFKGMVNGVISGLNSMIGALNGIHFSFPEWVPVLGGKDFGLNIPQIPQLANGGYIKHRPGGILANIGEGGEDEVVSPVSKLKNMLNSSSKTTNINNSVQPIQLHYENQITIQGNASKNDIVQALAISKGEFKKLMDDYNSGNQRLSFAR